jgi:hypothetical protein
MPSRKTRTALSDDGFVCHSLAPSGICFSTQATFSPDECAARFEADAFGAAYFVPTRSTLFPGNAMIRLPSTLSLALSILLLTACGGGEDATVGGSLSGLATGATLVLQNNATDTLTLTTNGSFNFANASGTIDVANDSVANVAVVCSSAASVGGMVRGLTPGTSVTLANGSAPAQVIAVDGSFAFPGVLAVGTTYSVTVTVQPAGGHSCVVTNGAGSITANTVVNVQVVCS